MSVFWRHLDLKTEWIRVNLNLSLLSAFAHKAIVNRFFEAFTPLISVSVTKTYVPFCIAHKIDQFRLYCKHLLGYMLRYISLSLSKPSFKATSDTEPLSPYNFYKYFSSYLLINPWS